MQLGRSFGQVMQEIADMLESDDESATDEVPVLEDPDDTPPVLDAGDIMVFPHVAHNPNALPALDGINPDGNVSPVSEGFEDLPPLEPI